MVTVSEITEKQELYRIEDQWQALVDSGTDRSPYITPSFLLPWLGLLGKEYSLRFLAAWDGDRLTGLLPLVSRKIQFPGISFTVLSFPMHGSTPPLDIIGGRTHSDVLDAFIRHLARDPGWDMLWFHNVPAESSTIPNLEKITAELHLGFENKKALSTFYVPIKNSWQDYFASLSKKMRSNMRRNLRNCEQWGQPGFLQSPSETLDVDSAMKMAFQVIEKSWKASDSDDHHKYRQFFISLARSLAKSDLLSMRFLLINEKPIAYLFEIKYKNRLFPFHSAYDADYQRVSPGQLLLGEATRACHEDSLERIDFYGTSKYLKRWPGESRSFVELTLTNVSFFSKVKVRGYLLMKQWRTKRARARTDRKKEAKKRLHR